MIVWSSSKLGYMLQTMATRRTFCGNFQHVLHTSGLLCADWKGTFPSAFDQRQRDASVLLSVHGDMFACKCSMVVNQLKAVLPQARTLLQILSVVIRHARTSQIPFTLSSKHRSPNRPTSAAVGPRAGTLRLTSVRGSFAYLGHEIKWRGVIRVILSSFSHCGVCRLQRSLATTKNPVKLLHAFSGRVIDVK